MISTNEFNIIVASQDKINKSSSSKTSKNWNITLTILIILVLVLTFYFGYKYLKISTEKGTYNLYAGLHQLDSVSTDSVKYLIAGKFVQSGNPMKKQKICIVTDNKKNNDISILLETDKYGSFDTTIWCFEMCGIDRELIVRTHVNWGKQNLKVFKFEKYLVNGNNSPANVDLFFPLFILVFFILSFVIPFSEIKPSYKFIFSILLAFIFSVGMISAVAFGIHYLNFIPDTGENLTFGFVTFFKGKFIVEASNEWILSLTTLQESSGLVSGFGVPLWVLFLSVVGSGVYTITLILSSISSKNKLNLEKLDNCFLANEEILDDTQLTEFRRFIENILKHQLYILFSPFASIFVYQAILATGAGGSVTIVALAALGSGLTFNIILNKGIKMAQDSMSSSNSPNNRN